MTTDALFPDAATRQPSDREGLFVVYGGDYREGRKPTGELFIDKVPDTDPDRLTLARARFGAALAAYNEAWRIDEECDGFGFIPDEIKAEMDESKRELAAAERERMQR